MGARFTGELVCEVRILLLTRCEFQIEFLPPHRIRKLTVAPIDSILQLAGAQLSAGLDLPGVHLQQEAVGRVQGGHSEGWWRHHGHPVRPGAAVLTQRPGRHRRRAGPPGAGHDARHRHRALQPAHLRGVHTEDTAELHQLRLQLQPDPVPDDAAAGGEFRGAVGGAAVVRQLPAPAPDEP